MIEARNFLKTLCQRGPCHFLPKFSLRHMRKCERNTPSVEKNLLKDISLSQLEFRCEYLWYFLSSLNIGSLSYQEKNERTCLTTGPTLESFESNFGFWQGIICLTVLWYHIFRSPICLCSIKFKDSFTLRCAVLPCSEFSRTLTKRQKWRTGCCLAISAYALGVTKSF